MTKLLLALVLFLLPAVASAQIEGQESTLPGVAQQMAKPPTVKPEYQPH